MWQSLLILHDFLSNATSANTCEYMNTQLFITRRIILCRSWSSFKNILQKNGCKFGKELTVRSKDPKATNSLSNAMARTRPFYLLHSLTAEFWPQFMILHVWCSTFHGNCF